ncbi:quinolinate synthase NadA [Halanaeroarchaeum sulfurireducens]
MPAIDGATFENDDCQFEYDNLEQLPPEYSNLDEGDRTDRIEKARAELGDDVVILGHNYQRREIIEHADFIGDSYQLSKKAADTDAEYVIFGGVRFMAESADIITDDDQTVILPNMEASCPMAGLAETRQAKAAWETISAETDGDVIPITYMNSYAALKAFSADHGGLVCTSSNADRAFEYAFDKGDTVLFLPDEHLGANTAHSLGLEEETVTWNPWDTDAKSISKAVDNDVILWNGYCQVHERFRVEHVEQARENYPDANVIVHPECRREVVAAADIAGSTADIIRAVEEADPGETWVIGTEIHLTNHLQRWHPNVTVVPLGGDAGTDCNAMGQIDPNYLTWVIEELAAGYERNVIEVSPDERELAKLALDRMLEI